MRTIGRFVLGAAMLAATGVGAHASDTQSVTIDSQPRGATCALTRSSIALGSVVTPAVVQVNRNKADIQVACRLPGHFDGTGVLKSDPDAARTGAAFILGGVIGMVGTLASGANAKYDEQVVVSLSPHPPGYVASTPLPALSTVTAPSAPPAPLSLPPPPVDPAIGSSHRDVIEIAGVQVPLLEGSWAVAGTGPASGGRAASLARIEQGRLWGLIHIWAGTSPRPVFDTCARTDVLFAAVTTNTQRGDQDCWIVNHSLVAQTRTETKDQHQRQAYEFLDARGVPLDGGLTLISSSHRVQSPSGFVTVLYQVNPEFFGFAPSRAATWRASEWHRDRIASDPKRVAFVEAYKSFNAQYQEHVKAGFRRQLQAFTPRPFTLAALAVPSKQMAQD
jgi:hypothetical protein